MPAVLLLLLLLPAAARANEVVDGSLVVGAHVAAGRSLSKGPLGEPYLIGGQAIFHGRGEWGLGVQLDRFDFKAKGGNKADASSLLGVARANIGADFEEALPYLLFGAGWSESRADVGAGGTDRGAGLALAFGGGVDFPLAGPFTWGLEARLLRLTAGLPRIGGAGASLMTLALRVSWWRGPSGDPFDASSR